MRQKKQNTSLVWGLVDLRTRRQQPSGLGLPPAWDSGCSHLWNYKASSPPPTLPSPTRGQLRLTRARRVRIPSLQLAILFILLFPCEPLKQGVFCAAF